MYLTVLFAAYESLGDLRLQKSQIRSELSVTQQRYTKVVASLLIILKNQKTLEKIIIAQFVNFGSEHL